ncbi:MAG: hypothetical protein BWX92_01857 [Deltaproteobacteria bacterium ADurb.Bin135]|nr:MAG: hypothetical protein BWX92_01857 [Deltaproteobacteria bacterium ADurb.Bin135]
MVVFFRIGAFMPGLNPCHETFFQHCIIFGIIFIPKAFFPAVAQDYVHHHGVTPLKMPEQFRIKAKLDYEFGFGVSGELCVYNLIAIVSKR